MKSKLVCVIIHVFMGVILAANSFRANIISGRLEEFCFRQVSLPEDAMLNPYNDSLPKVCNGTYLQGCTDVFNATCQFNTITCTNETNYLHWTNAYRQGSTKYLCGQSPNKFKATFNLTCIQEVGQNVSNSLEELMKVLYFGNTTNCTDMAYVLNGVLLGLNGCSDKAMRNEFKDYFQSIVNLSPCQDILLSGAPLIVPSIIAVFLTLFVTLYRMFD